jgi:hypothetical protein
VSFVSLLWEQGRGSGKRQILNHQNMYEKFSPTLQHESKTQEKGCVYSIIIFAHYIDITYPWETFKKKPSIILTFSPRRNISNQRVSKSSSKRIQNFAAAGVCSWKAVGICVVTTTTTTSLTTCSSSPHRVRSPSA